MPTFPNTGAAGTLTHVYGSCKLEVSTDSGSTWYNVGLARGVQLQENPEISDIQADNGPDIVSYVSRHTATISWNSLEIYLPNLNRLRGGIDTLAVSSADATTITDSWASSEWAYNTALFLSQQGDSTTLPNITAVKTHKSGSTTALTTNGKDYVKTLDANNQRGVIVLSTDFGGDAKDTESLRVTYVYGKINARTLATGGLSTITPFWFRLTNKQMVNGVAKYRYITFYSVSLASGLNFAFKSGNEADPILESPFSLTAKLDTTRSEGSQLFLIEDQVATA